MEGEYADAVIGRFNGKPQYVVAVEGKGPRDPLDRPHAGRRRSAVEQAYKYAINLPCDWVIVTNIRQVRLYSKNTDQQTYERFDTERLTADEPLLRKFVYLLGSERVLPGAGRCHLYDLREASEKAGRDVTDAYYRAYAEIRRAAFERLREANPGREPAALLAAAQKVLDRVLFIAFSEDRGLLPPETIRSALEHADPYNPRPVWDNFRGLFRAIDEGREAPRIPRYNGGLFAADTLLDTIVVSDDVCAKIAELRSYEYGAPSEVAQDVGDAGEGDDGPPLVDVDILGHIFEQSITDLERLQGEVKQSRAGEHDGEEDGDGRTRKQPSRRKREGAFYTPSFITRYIVEQALGGVLRERFEALRGRHRSDATGPTKAVLDEPSAYDLAAITPARRETLVRFWQAWQAELGTVRLLDPACGSGAFLVEAFDQLYAAYERTNERLADLRGQRQLFDLDKQILQHNLYGVDLNEEASRARELAGRDAGTVIV